ncbi:methyltransferase family protein [Streptomyces sp. 1114.5]|uniref:class I SAM-dependent methyltransferase n=1 Tax=unclassified Streptomyces TaxID=2593676 RepID=UPI000BCEA208|nr:MULTISPECIES: class I SAM-dependent methyltransferase [unclassified Streptomyces]RKT11831.1 methyltransferase family protein [Streptomyces sp. 1114.5]SOB80424.1 Methyltransferase domain-containing protein [Streptomyces sp. 1331.2]
MTDAALPGEPQHPAEPASLDDVQGWFWDHDRHSFDWFLGRQEKTGVTGDLLEMGAYLGRSAIVIGEHLQPGETFTVCDLFDSEAPDDENAAEMDLSYRKTLTRSAFETNYLAFHDELPEIIQAPTGVLSRGHISPGTFRFIHIDASHLYEHVVGDLQVARVALQEQGVVVLDDYRAQHTPGVAAATWEAVFNHGLKPILLTECKFYGTWGDPEPFQRELLDRVDLAVGCQLSIDHLNGNQVLRMYGDSEGIEPFRGSRHQDRLAADAAHLALDSARGEAEMDLAVRRARAAEARRPVNVAKRAARDLLPPVVTSAIRRARRG